MIFLLGTSLALGIAMLCLGMLLEGIYLLDA